MILWALSLLICEMGTSVLTQPPSGGMQGRDDPQDRAPCRQQRMRVKPPPGHAEELTLYIWEKKPGLPGDSWGGRAVSLCSLPTPWPLSAPICSSRSHESSLSIFNVSEALARGAWLTLGSPRPQGPPGPRRSMWWALE